MKIRIKRPKGLTFQIKNLKNITNEIQYKKERERIINRVINEYVQDGFRLNNKPSTIKELAEFMELSIIEIIKRMNRMGSYLLGNKDEAYRALLANTISSLLENRAVIGTQLNMLSTQQNGKYVPFLSGMVNDSIGRLIANDTNTIRLLTIMKPFEASSGSPITINNNPIGQALTNNNLLNVNDAVKLIDKQREVPLLESQNKIDNLESRYIEEGTPEILARKQQGTNSDGLVRPKKKLKIHELRREDEGEIINPEIS